ncbi:MAG: hypothetical protein JSR65_00840 [Proteobacteria bacterium]|nr:hypothetical protein [Pseudomonadota bacterium]
MVRSTPAFALVLALGFIAPAFAGGQGDIDKVNGAITVDDGSNAGKLTTVNGSIRLGANAHAKRAETVNGGIHLGAGSALDAAESVNGGIKLGDNAKVASTVDVVNGSITLGRGADIGGKASNVNGNIQLDAAHVGGGIDTVNGDITIGANSRVEGGILVEENRSWFNFGSRKPRIVIGPHAVVQGTLKFKREVELWVSDSATIGPIEGATAQKFSGEQPPQ